MPETFFRPETPGWLVIEVHVAVVMRDSGALPHVPLLLAQPKPLWSGVVQ